MERQFVHRPKVIRSIITSLGRDHESPYDTIATSGVPYDNGEGIRSITKRIV